MSVTTDTPVKPLAATVVTEDKPLPSIRSWAVENGYTVGARGRFHIDILTAYAAAHGLEAPPAPKSVSAPYVPSPIRSWALENGFTVPARGRFSREVVAAYNAAHGISVETVDKPAKIKKSRKKKVAEAPVDEREAKVVKVGGRSGSPLICGFCTTDNHDHCPDVVVNGANVAYNVKCACADKGHV